MLTYLSKLKAIKVVCKLQVELYSPSPSVGVIDEQTVVVFFFCTSI